MNDVKDWISQTSIYEVNLRQYTQEGTIKAFSSHLPRLRDMGVETLWFMPLTPISQKGMKGSLGSYYACSSYTALNPEFGTIDDFRDLVNAAHAMGFRVIIDWVANHTGWDHHWTVEHPEWYKKDRETGEFQKASGMDDIIELDFSNEYMRAAMIEAMAFWIDACNIDGFRCDLAFWVPLDFWKHAAQALANKKSLFWLAEADMLDHPDYMQVFDAAYTWTWMHRTEEFYKQGQRLADLLPILDQYQRAPGFKAWFTSNHDENSWNGSEYEKYGSAAMMLTVHSLTWPGIPLIYTGQEVGNERRLKFFDKDPLQWEEEPRLHSFYKNLLSLRRANKAMNADATVVRIHSSADEKVLIFLREAENAAVMVLLNFSGAPVRLDLYDTRASGRFRNLFNDQQIDLDEQRVLFLDPWGYLVFEGLS